MSRFYSGSALNGVDGKNRLSVPAAFREAVEARSGERAVILSPHGRLPCLVGYDRAHFERVSNQIERKFGDDFGEAREDHVREMFGAAEHTPYDETGRIILSAILKEMGSLDRLGFFVGAGDYFELWDPQQFLATKGEDGVVARRLSHLMRARG